MCEGKIEDVSILNGRKSVRFTGCLNCVFLILSELCSKKYCAPLYTNGFETASHTFINKICTIHIKINK
jgi:hypothetical protein